jgi:SMODS-associating 2TM, beta-strand rich effector domain
MKNIRMEFAIWMQFIAFLFIWATMLYVSGIQLTIDFEALKKFPEAIAGYSAIHLIFTKWLWRFTFLQGWLVPFPDLQGTWNGTIETTWVNPDTGIRPNPVPVRLVIRQSFTSISCKMYSHESFSFSTAAQIVGEDDLSDPRLSFCYTNRPKATARDRSAMHDGAATLRILTKPERALEGQYWTDRKSTGDIRVKFSSRTVIDSLP